MNTQVSKHFYELIKHCPEDHIFFVIADIGVGSYLSNDVVIFRTIPVVTAVGSVRFPSGTLWADLQEFNISSCISYEGKHLKSHLRKWWEQLLVKSLFVWHLWIRKET